MAVRVYVIEVIDSKGKRLYRRIFNDEAEAKRFQRDMEWGGGNKVYFWEM